MIGRLNMCNNDLVRLLSLVSDKSNFIAIAFALPVNAL